MHVKTGPEGGTGLDVTGGRGPTRLPDVLQRFGLATRSRQEGPGELVAGAALFTTVLLIRPGPQVGWHK
ncbi:hypothetical protein [Streptomyces panaciradicis]|uniref:hypothetical protein n=1 Tax=Streptomyces panaciradicis TaxID=1470261 RepID=UPI00201D241E|nr:hypothetical protein [Streptomyces panaciradicis]MCL6670501.1 hypothetical protein [Streptomyces panaciradicis]